MKQKPAQDSLPSASQPQVPDECVETSGVVGRLFSLTEQNLPLPAALWACAEESPSPFDAREMRRLARAIEQGTPLESAVRTGTASTQLIATLVEAGLKTGQLPALLKSYLISARHNRSLWRSFWLSLSYPLIVMAASTVLMMAILIGIVPMFKVIFNDFGVELPSSTILLLIISDVLTTFWMLAVASMMLAAFVIITSSWTPLWSFWNYLPVIGHAARKAGLSEFCSLLSVFVECGTPLPDSLRAIGAASRSYSIRALSNTLARRLEEGLTPLAATEDPDVPTELAQAFRWSGQQGQFAMLLRNQAQALAAEAQIQFRFMLFLLEPALIIMLGMAAGFIIFGLFAPLIKLFNELS